MGGREIGARLVTEEEEGQGEITKSLRVLNMGD